MANTTPRQHVSPYTKIMAALLAIAGERDHSIPRETIRDQWTQRFPDHTPTKSRKRLRAALHELTTRGLIERDGHTVRIPDMVALVVFVNAHPPHNPVQPVNGAE